MRCNFLCSLLTATLYMFRASLVHHQELRNCVCSLWYCHVDLYNNRQYSFVYRAMINVVQYNVDVYWLWYIDIIISHNTTQFYAKYAQISHNYMFRHSLGHLQVVLF